MPHGAHGITFVQHVFHCGYSQIGSMSQYCQYDGLSWCAGCAGVCVLVGITFLAAGDCQDRVKSVTCCINFPSFYILLDFFNQHGKNNK